MKILCWFGRHTYSIIECDFFTIRGNLMFTKTWECKRCKKKHTVVTGDADNYKGRHA